MTNAAHVFSRIRIRLQTGTKEGVQSHRKGAIHRDYSNVRGTLFGRSLWARGYCVGRVRFDEESVRRYIEEQEEHEQRQEWGRLMCD